MTVTGIDKQLENILLWRLKNKKVLKLFSGPHHKYNVYNRISKVCGH